MRRSQSLLLVVLIGLLTACARQTTAQGTPPQTRVEQSPEEALRARATQFWEARVKGDLAAQYDLLEPKAREQVTLTGYVRARSGVVFLSYTLQEVEVAGAEGTVTANATFRLNLPQASRFGPWTQAAITRWVRVEGLWYLRYESQV